MYYHVFESGSKGNCTLFASQGHYLIIDNGLSGRKFKAKLSEVGRKLEDVEAVLITHSHTDHIAGIEIFNPSILYAPKYVSKLVSASHELIPFESYDIAGFHITCVPTSHDAQGSCGYILEADGEKLVYITDTGYIYERVVDIIGNADYYIFESNHNVRMLMATNRPQSLKKRILGDMGHMSNEDSANYICDVIGDKTKEIILAHLSEEANSPEKAIADYKEVFEKRDVDFDAYRICCASQTETVSGGNRKEDSYGQH